MKRSIITSMQTDVLLSKYTTLGIGGPAKYFCKVESIEDITNAIKWAKEKGLPFIVIGDGSNLLISDEGFPGLVIKNKLTGISTWEESKPTSQVCVKSGTGLWNLVSFAIDNSLGGIEKLSGIPGTVGGAIYGNAGAFGQTIANCLIEVTCLNPNSEEIVVFTKDQCNFGYRDSDFKRNDLIILEAKFEFKPNNSQTLKEESAETLRKRAHYVGIKSVGSFFKNIPAEKLSPDILKLIPEEKLNHGKVPAGYLLESVGSFNQQIGDIKTSDFHANVFINRGEGKATDFYNLVSDLARKVKEKFGIDLEPEAQFINLPPLHI